MASWVEAGPGSSSSRRCRPRTLLASIQSCSSTHSRRKRPMCVGGPPKPMHPMRPHCGGDHREWNDPAASGYGLHGGGHLVMMLDLANAVRSGGTAGRKTLATGDQASCPPMPPRSTVRVAHPPPRGGSHEGARLPRPGQQEWDEVPDPPSSTPPTRSSASTPSPSAAPTCTSSRATSPRSPPAASSVTRRSARSRQSAHAVTTTGR